MSKPQERRRVAVIARDDDTLTADELQSVCFLVEAVESGRDDDARFWSARPSVISALAKMRAAAKAAKESVQ